MDFQQEFIQIGNVQIRYYGIIIVLAMLVAAWVASRLARQEKRDPDHVWGALTWAIIPGIIFARLWFVLFPPISAVAEGRDTGWYLSHFFDVNNGAIAIWSGGLSIFGAVLGGMLGAYIYMRRNDLQMSAWLDIAGVALPLAQAIGRWANYVNQELYGLPTNLPWGIQIDAAHRVGDYQSLIDYPVNETFFHPLFLYESLWSLRRYRYRLFSGDVFLLYVIQYAFIRFLLEFLRIEVAHIPGTDINSSQAMTAVAFVLALGFFLYRHWAGTPEEEPEQQPAAEPQTTTEE